MGFVKLCLSALSPFYDGSPLALRCDTGVFSAVADSGQNGAAETDSYCALSS